MRTELLHAIIDLVKDSKVKRNLRRKRLEGFLLCSEEEFEEFDEEEDWDDDEWEDDDDW
ncbi:MAG: hypothetical protein ACFFF4_04880 [Candidatus Thorarchaeota archaeon]